MPKLIKIWNKEIKKNIFLRNIKSDHGCYRDVFEGRYHVLELEEEPKYVLDLGSNIGLTIAHYRHLWPDAKILGFEMDSENCWMANKNAEDSNASVWNYAVSTNLGYVSYSKTPGRQQCYRIGRETDNSWKAVSVHMDHAVNSAGNGNPVDFVKMDIEGAEFDIIKQGGAWTNKVRNLLVEVHGLNEKNTHNNVKRVKKMLEEKDFIVKRHEIHWSALHACKKI
jgi:FkbM family methyltransferase